MGTNWTIAVDPGDTHSAYVERTNTGKFNSFGKAENGELKNMLAKYIAGGGDHLAIEMIASYGMPVGREVFETCVWIGRFVEAWGRPFSFVYRRDVKLHLCGSPRAKDANVRQAVIDRLGPVGTKKQPGPLYGVKADVWQALAVALTFDDTMRAKVEPEPLLKCDWGEAVTP